MATAKAKRALKEAGDEDILAEVEAAEEAEITADALEKPELSELLEYFDELRNIKSAWDIKATRERERRYLKDKLPLRWQNGMQDGRRFYSRLTHNEVIHRARQQTSNLPQCSILPDGMDEADTRKAATQTRWANELMPAFERQNPGFRMRAVDCQLEIGFAAYEVYLTGSYDDLDYEPRDKPDGTSEKPHEILARNEKDARNRKLPMGVRFCDGQSLYIDRDEGQVCAAFIYERKAWHSTKRRYKKKGKDIGDKPNDRPSPNPGDYGFPGGDTSGKTGPGGVETCETIRYYDEHWYAYIVNGRFVEGPVLHKLTGGVPVFPFMGVITSAANWEDGVEGICWGLESAELLINDTMTLEADNVHVYSRPKWVIQTPVAGTIMPAAPGQKQPGQNGAVLNLNEPGIKQLNPGQELVNATKDFVPFMAQNFLSTALALFGRSTQNPIAQGESPGASPAGYTVATLTGNATSVDNDQVKNEAVAWGQVVDCCRRIVRDTIKHPVWMAAPMENNESGGVEWLKMEPEDITEVATICEIDPDNDATRLANRQSWIEGNTGGYVPRREVQIRAFGARDPARWDYELIKDKAQARLADLAVEMAIEETRAFGMGEPPPPPPPGSGLVGPNGEELPSTLRQPGAGGAPSDPNAPPVGAVQSQASQASSQALKPGGMKANDAQQKAGQNRGYVPTSERM